MSPWKVKPSGPHPAAFLDWHAERFDSSWIQRQNAPAFDAHIVEILDAIRSAGLTVNQAAKVFPEFFR